MALLKENNVIIRSNDGRAAQAARLDEKQYVEEPLLEQLESLGWEVIRLGLGQRPEKSFRDHFGEVVLLPKLEAALRAINPFLRDDQVDEVVRKITRLPHAALIENNQHVLELLLENTTVAVDYDTGESGPTVRYIDFRQPENNSFIAIAQFKVRVPGSEHYIIPDVTLFVNGLPLVVIECKSSKLNDPISQAIDQLLRYSQQRGDEREGNRELFYYNHFIVVTCRQEAKFGTITTHAERHFYRWTDPYPLTLTDLPHKGTSPNDQQRLVAGMCAKDNLLSLLESFTIFSTEAGKTYKIVGRYQQFRAVKLTIQRLLQGRNKNERGGIIWHTQGSGKSLTMVFLAREMRKHPILSKWKIVFVTDRIQLEEQFTDTSRGIGQTVKVAEWIEPQAERPNRSLKELLSNRTNDLVMAMIHKLQERAHELETIFPELDDSPHILVMIDEAHRTQYSKLGANLDKALPNATRIAFTGTPIDRTLRTFGDYIDTYTMRQSIEDGTTLAIVYEGRTDNAEIADRDEMNQRFEDMFSEYRLSERLRILGYGTREAYLEANEIIRIKARDMAEHYVQYVFPNGYKAQVVATSREAAVRYKAALDDALKAKASELERRNPLAISVDLLRKLETAVVISGRNNDPPNIRKYTNKNEHSRIIERFKMRFDATKDQDGDTVNGFVGIIVVNEMLLTGFDAPIEQVLYLDNVLTGHNLLQAIARVNRVADENKEKGFVVDYVGLGRNLKRALDIYAERERERDEILDALSSDQRELDALEAAHRAMWELLKRYGLTDLTDLDAFYDFFYDEDMRFAYISAFRRLTHALDLVYPHKEALEYELDYQRFAAINALAHRYLPDERLDLRGVPAKLRGITDSYLASQGITQKIAPISITDSNFLNDVQTRTRSKTRAAAVEHAIRHFIDLHIDEDPELFGSFAEAIERILEQHKNNWDAIYKELEKLRQEILAREHESIYGLDQRRHMPIFRVFKSVLAPDRELTEEEISQLVNLTQHTFNIIAREVRSTGFWDSVPAQYRLQHELTRLFASEDFYVYPQIYRARQEIITRLMEWSRASYAVIVRGS